MTQGSDHVTGQDADNDEDQEQAMRDVQESIAVRRACRNPRKPSWLTINMIVAYALAIKEEAIPSTYKKAEISLESKMWKDAMMEEMNSFIVDPKVHLSGYDDDYLM